MVDTLRTKSELLTIFSDTSGLKITKQNIRDFIVSNLVEETQIASVNDVVSKFTDTFLALPGCSEVTLPTEAEYGDRELNVVNASGGDLEVFAAFGETIEGGASVIVKDQQFLTTGAVDATLDWKSLVNTSVDAPISYALATIQGSVAITAILTAVWMDINESYNDAEKSNDFTIAPAGIEYLGTSTKQFAADLSLSLAKDAGAVQNYSLALAINGTPVTPFMGQTLANALFGISTLSSIISLDTNDVVKVQIRGEGTSDDVVVQDMTLRLTEIRA